MAVVLLQHAEVVVAELVGDVFDGQSGVGHQAGGGVAERLRRGLRLSDGNSDVGAQHDKVEIHQRDFESNLEFERVSSGARWYRTWNGC